MKIKSKSSWILICGLLLLTASSLCACSSTTSNTQPVVPLLPDANVPDENAPAAQLTAEEDVENSHEWNTIQSFSGTDSTTTTIVHISGTKWRIIWKIDPERPEYSIFNFIVYRAGKFDKQIKNIANSENISQGTIQIDEGGHDYYIKVIAANLSNWEISIQDYYTAFTSPAVQIKRIHYKGTIYEPEAECCNCFNRIEPDEYVVIKNQTDEWVDIRGWKLANESKEYVLFTFPELFPGCPSYFDNYGESANGCFPPRQCVLGPQQTILVYTDEFHSDTGGFNFNYGQGDIWDNEIPETAVLYNASGEEVSRKTYIIPPDSIAAEN